MQPLQTLCPAVCTSLESTMQSLAVLQCKDMFQSMGGVMCWSTGSITFKDDPVDPVNFKTWATCTWAASFGGQPARPAPMRGMATDCIPLAAACASTDWTVLASRGTSSCWLPASTRPPCDHASALLAILHADPNASRCTILVQADARS